MRTMNRILGIVTSKLLLFLNLTAVLIFWASCLASRIDPTHWWPFGFLALLMPYLAAVVFLFLPVWLVAKPKWSLLSILGLIVAAGPLQKVIPFRSSTDFEFGKRAGNIRLMTWNLRYFAPFKNAYFDSEKKSQAEAVLKEVERLDPDIVFFQEFVNQSVDDTTDVVNQLMRDHGYVDAFIAGDRRSWKNEASGMALFSKYPLVDAKLLEFPEGLDQSVEKPVMADIRIGADTVRFYSIHLQSFGFLPRDYWAISRIKRRSDSALASSKSLLGKMKNTFRIHAQQAVYLAGLFGDDPYPTVICGDLNDVPNSYAYTIIRADRKDVHLEKGSGLGKTYTSPSSRTMGKLPTLRIDYIFTDPKIETVQMATGKPMLSDHQAVVADIRLPQKE